VLGKIWRRSALFTFQIGGLLGGEDPIAPVSGPSKKRGNPNFLPEYGDYSFPTGERKKKDGDHITEWKK